MIINKKGIIACSTLLIRLKLFLFAGLGWLLIPLYPSLLQAQQVTNTLQIVSPLDGAVVTNGIPLTVVV